MFIVPFGFEDLDSNIKRFNSSETLSNPLYEEGVNREEHVNSSEGWIDISTVDDFEKINENPKGNFRLINDIDVSGVGGSLVSEDFSGRFVGNGYEIKTTHRIFERVESGYISDLRIDIEGDLFTFAPLAGIVAGASVIERVHTKGSLTSADVAGVVAGLADNSIIKDSYTEIDSKGFYVSGVAIGLEDNAKIINTYVSGNLNLESGVYPFSMYIEEENAIINSYWNKDVVGEVTEDQGTGLTDSEMRKQSSFKDWDFENVWEMNGKYPELRVFNFSSGDEMISFKQNGNSTWEQSQSTVVTVKGYKPSSTLEYVWSTSTSTPNSGWKEFESGDEITLKEKTGEYYLHIRGINLIGEEFNARSNSFYVDNTNPSLELSRNTSNYTNKDVEITAKGSDNHSGVNRIRMSGDSSWTNGDTLTKTVSENGTYTFQVEDNAGNRTSKSITVDNIDKEKPKISLSSDGGDWARSHSTKITATDDELGIKKLEYRRTTSSSFSSSNFSSTSSGSAVNVPKESGKHYLHVKATDKAGNEAKHTSKAFKIDREKPQLTITSNTTSETHEDVILTAKGKDSYSGVKRIKNPDGKWENKEEVTFTVTKNGTYEFKVEDHAGNTSKESVKVDNINKTMSLKKPTIDNFGSVGLEKEYKRVGISPIKVSDWRDGGNNWRLNVSASNLTNGTDTLPSGLIKLRGVEKVKKLSGEGSTPSYSTRESYIDASISEIASGSNSRGEFEIRFVPDALEIHIDPSVMKEGTYETEITWELINAP